MLRTALAAAMLAAAICVAFPTSAPSHDGPHKQWLESLMRPDNDRHPQRQLDRKSLFCCGEADIVRMKFRVANTDGRYPNDQWYAWLDESWTFIPPEKIIREPSPNGEAFLFVLARTIQCFVPPKGGI
jgi:hypothetical protein